MSKKLWEPSQKQVFNANLTAFMKFVGPPINDYNHLYEWSVNNIDKFWLALWKFCKVKATETSGVVITNEQEMEKVEFFPNAQINYAENLLKRNDDSTAIVFWGENKVKRSLSWADLNEQVATLAAALKHHGLKKGDRVAGFVPNTPEAVIAMLATASLGGIWSSCSPDFGVEGVLDRFQQIEPKFLFAANGYYYNGKTFDCSEKLSTFIPSLPTLEKVIIFNYTDNDFKDIPLAASWDEFNSGFETETIAFEQVEFNHPLFIMFSSGTTGKPKCIVHGHGGTLLEHLKEHQLHCDIKPDDRVFYFTTCGWMMWNWLVSALASEATLMLYDGSPFYPDGNILMDYCQTENFTLFGASAKYIDALNNGGFKPIKTHSFPKLRMITSTGSPLVPESFDYVYSSIKSDVCLASISGGTDIIGCFILGNPIGPVYRGELQTRSLGMSVQVFDENGKPVKGEKGELVCTKPFPSMPVMFWNDPNGEKYHNSYFSRYENIWCHGDFVELTQNDGIIIYGRSDAVLNPGGVRIGTAEIYRQVESFDEIVESISVGQEWESDIRVLLFVKMKDGCNLNEELIAQIKTKIKNNASPRHVPAKIIQVNDIPRTISGKIVELAVREVIHNRPVRNLESLANPEALNYFKGIKEISIK